MREPNNIQKKIWKAYGKVGNKLPSGEFKIYRPTQFQIDPIQDAYLRGTSKAYLEEKKSSSNPFGGLTEYDVYLNARFNDIFTCQAGDYLWDQVDDKTYVITDNTHYSEIKAIELPNRISISRTQYVETSNGTEAQLVSLVASLPCIVEFGAFYMAGVVPASSPAQAGYDQIKITTAIDPSLIQLGDIVTHNGVDMSILQIIYTPETRGAIIIAKVMG